MTNLEPVVFNGNTYPIHEMLSFEIATKTITPTGQGKVAEFLEQNRLPALPDDWDWHWTVTRGVYVGTFTKRYAAYAYKKHGVDVPGLFLQHLGNIASDNCQKPMKLTFDFDRDFEWERGTFGEDEQNSCFWTDRPNAFPTMRVNNIAAVRFWENTVCDCGCGVTEQRGLARAFLAFDKPDEGEAILFNGYGRKESGLQTRDIARIIATWQGLSYEMIGITNHGDDHEPIWFNGPLAVTRNADFAQDMRGEGRGGGFVLCHPKRAIELRAHYTRPRQYDLKLKFAPILCSRCGANCGTQHDLLSDVYIVNSRTRYCRDCAETAAVPCAYCERRLPEATLTVIHGERVCNDCQRRSFLFCHHCMQITHKANLTEIDGHSACRTCVLSVALPCDRHRRYYWGTRGCPDCHDEARIEALQQRRVVQATNSYSTSNTTFEVSFQNQVVTTSPQIPNVPLALRNRIIPPRVIGVDDQDQDTFDMHDLFDDDDFVDPFDDDDFDEEDN